MEASEAQPVLGLLVGNAVGEKKNPKMHSAKNYTCLQRVIVSNKLITCLLNRKVCDFLRSAFCIHENFAYIPRLLGKSSKRTRGCAILMAYVLKC